MTNNDTMSLKVSALVRGEHKTAHILIENMKDPDSVTMTEILFSLVNNSAKIMSVQLGPVENKDA